MDEFTTEELHVIAANNLPPFTESITSREQLLSKLNPIENICRHEFEKSSFLVTSCKLCGKPEEV